MESTEQFISRIERRQKYLQNLDIKSFGLFDGPKQYVHSCNLYISCFKVIPSKIILHHTDTLKLVGKIEKEFKEKILGRHYMRYSLSRKLKHRFSNIIFVMDNEIFIDIEITGEVNILFNENSEEEAKKYEKTLRQKYRLEKENKIYLLAQGHFLEPTSLL